MSYLLLINENSGGVQRISADVIEREVASYLKELGESAPRVVTGPFEALVEAARSDHDAKAVICAGGDGAQAGVAAQLLHKNTPLLALPCGTVNEFCRDLGLPLDIGAALREGLAAPTVKIDAARAGGRVFLNNVVFGAYADIASAREEFRNAENISQMGEAIAGAAETLFETSCIDFELTIDGAPINVSTNTIIVSNNAICESRDFIPYRPRLDEGKLAIYISQAQNAADFARVLSNFLIGSAQWAEDISEHKAMRCEVACARNDIAYTIDGEPTPLSGALSIAIEPASLCVFAPGAAAPIGQ